MPQQHHDISKRASVAWFKFRAPKREHADVEENQEDQEDQERLRVERTMIRLLENVLDLKDRVSQLEKRFDSIPLSDSPLSAA